jgi:hypothetical protein
LLSHQFRTPKCNKGLTASFAGRHVPPEILFDDKFEMSRHFGIEFAVQSPAPEEAIKAMEQCSYPVDHELPLARRMLKSRVAIASRSLPKYEPASTYLQQSRTAPSMAR